MKMNEEDRAFYRFCVRLAYDVVLQAIEIT